MDACWAQRARLRRAQGAPRPRLGGGRSNTLHPPFLYSTPLCVDDHPLRVLVLRRRLLRRQQRRLLRPVLLLPPVREGVLVPPPARDDALDDVHLRLGLGLFLEFSPPRPISPPGMGAARGCPAAGWPRAISDHYGAARRKLSGVIRRAPVPPGAMEWQKWGKVGAKMMTSVSLGTPRGAAADPQVQPGVKTPRGGHQIEPPPGGPAPERPPARGCRPPLLTLKFCGLEVVLLHARV